MKAKRLFTVVVFLAFQSLWADAPQYVHKYAVVGEYALDAEHKFKQHIQEQSAALLGLWKQGIVENVYLNVNENQAVAEAGKLSVVFFIKANNQTKAHKILAKLPFVKYNVVNYSLYPVGVLWLERFQKSP